MNVLDSPPSGLQQDAGDERSNMDLERGGTSPREKSDVSTTTYDQEPEQKAKIGIQTWLNLIGLGLIKSI